MESFSRLKATKSINVDMDDKLSDINKKPNEKDAMINEIDPLIIYYNLLCSQFVQQTVTTAHSTEQQKISKTR